MTARELIRRALLLFGAVDQDEAVDATEANDALASLNDILEGWSANGDAIYQETKESFPLTGAGSYTIGSGGDFNTIRPTKIITAFTRSGGLDYPLELIDQKFYAEITQKSLGSSHPSYLYYDGGFPLGTIYLWPTSSYELHLYSMKPLTSITSLDTTINLPPGYAKAIRYNLAVELAPEYGKMASPDVQRIATESKYDIDTANRLNDQDRLRVDSALLRTETYNIYSG